MRLMKWSHETSSGGSPAAGERGCNSDAFFRMDVLRRFCRVFGSQARRTCAFAKRSRSRFAGARVFEPESTCEARVDSR
jgi:hypothetical protein